VTAQDKPETDTASGLLEASYASMVQGDLHRDGADKASALESYRKALSGFITASQKYPEIDPEVVKFRIAYCDNQIETLMKESGVNGSRLPATPEERDSMTPAHVQTAGAAADAMGIQLRAVREQIAQRELTEARSALITLLRQSPDDPEIRILMAIVQCMLGRFDDADNMMTTLIQEKPTLSRAYAVLSTAKIGLGDLTEAKNALSKAISLGSASPEVYYNMTQVILATKPLDAEAARAHYKKSLQMGGRRDPDLDYLLK
jgi:Flp pilus assembly protein TadD